MGLGPDVWGPHGWKFIHFISLGYPRKPTDDDKNNYKNFFNMIPNILPCSICSNHFKENLIKHPLTDDIMNDRIKLLNWSIDMHNEVNLITNKQIIDYEQGLNLVINNFNIPPEEHIKENNIKESFTNSNVSNNNISKKVYEQKDYTNYILLFIVLVLVILYLYYNAKKHPVQPQLMYYQ
jgi:hypothetical protein